MIRAVFLKPGEHLDGIPRLDTKLFGGLKPGVYRIEAVLWSWRDEKFTDAGRSELARMGIRFCAGKVPNSTSVMWAKVNSVHLDVESVSGSRARKKQTGVLLVWLFPLRVAAAERSGGSPPGEPQRSAAAAKAGAD